MTNAAEAAAYRAVVKSSGNETLDDDAGEAVKHCRHNPARSAGEATDDGVIRKTFRFEIIDRL